MLRSLRDFVSFLADLMTLASFFSGYATLRWIGLLRPRVGEIVSLMNWVSIVTDAAVALAAAFLGTWAAGGRRRTYKGRARIGIVGVAFVLLAVYLGLFQYWSALLAYSQNPPIKDTPAWTRMAQELTILFTAANACVVVGIVLLLIASVGLYPYHR